MVVDAYTTTGQGRLPATATDDLTVQTVDLSPAGGKPLETIDFKVAIRDEGSHTLRLFSGQTFRRLPVQNVLAHCQKGDHIVLLTLDNRSALPPYRITKSWFNNRPTQP